MHARLALTDAAGRRDPTKTGPLRRNFAAAADQRLRTLKAATRKAIVSDNVLGFTGQAGMPAFGPAAGARAEAFHEWFGAANDQSVLGRTGAWLTPYIAQAMHQGVADAQREVKGTPPQAVPIHEPIQLHAQLALHELRGISGALRQQVDRAVGAGLGTNRRKNEVYRGVNKAFSTIRPRALALTHHAVVKAYNKAKLITYKEAGYSKVGIDPEYLPAMFARDRNYEDDPEMVNILTAGDGYVCEECEEIAANGPYDIDEADGLIPAHPNCRCAFVPFGDQRFAPIEEQLDDPDQEYFDAFDPEQPRDDQGQWTSGGGGGGGAAGGEHAATLGHGYSKQAHLEGGTIYTSNVFDAARALYENRHVILDQPRQLSTLIDHLGQVAKHMIAMGGKAPTFNLCNVSVAGTNLFCAETKGIPRVKMPQLDDDQTKLFKKYLKAQGYKVEKTKELASHLRATQNELDGVKVAKTAARLRADPEAKERRLVVSKDNYILDGHHYWAGSIGVDAQDNKLGDKNMKVSRVNIGIVQLLKEAEEFTHGGGHKGFGDAFDPDEPRDEHGRWSAGGGSELEKVPSIKEAISRGALHFRPIKERKDYSGKTTVYEVEPNDIPASWETHVRPITGSITKYDPATAHIVDDVVVPKNEVDDFPKHAEPDTLYRGMSYEEYTSAMRSGAFKSEGSYNIGEQEKGLTYFSSDPRQAQSYAHGFAPWQYAATPTRPAVVVAVKDPGGHIVHPQRPSEIGITGKVPTSSIKQVYFGKPYAIKAGQIDVINEFGRVAEGSRMSPSIGVLWGRKATRDYDPNQERDYHGRFGSGGAPEGEQLSMFKTKEEELGLPPNDIVRQRPVAPYDLQQANEKIMNDWFPNINSEHLKVLTDGDGHYNCIASAFGDTKKFWWPDDDYGLFWPDDVQKTNDVESFDDLMIRKLGGSITNELVEPGYVKIALYTDENGEPTHMARQQSDGRWSSKLGGAYLILHDLHEMEDGNYGNVEKIYKVPTESWKTLRDME